VEERAAGRTARRYLHPASNRHAVPLDAHPIMLFSRGTCCAALPRAFAF